MPLHCVQSNTGFKIRWLFFLFTWHVFGGCQPPFADSERLEHAGGVIKNATYNKSDAAFLVQLGEKLFFEKALSIDSTIACASCHLPAFAFSDTLPLSRGVGGVFGNRNAPSLINVGAATLFNRDGGVRALNMQAIVPITEPHEMAFDIHLAPKRLWPAYESFFSMYEVDSFSPSMMLDALAAFQKTLISGDLVINSPFVSEKAKTGEAIFLSERTNCSTCHALPLYTDFSFQNNGLYKDFADRGRETVTHHPEDRGKFKVPSLINVAITGPYMHDGSLRTLEEVVAHYNSGGKSNKLQHKAIKPLNLTNYEVEALVEFLESLTEVSRSVYANR